MKGHLGALIPGQREPGYLGQAGQDLVSSSGSALGIVAGGQVDQAQRPARCRAGGGRVRTRSRPGAAAGRDSKHQRRRHRTGGCRPPPLGRTGGPRSSGGQGDLRFLGVRFHHAGDSGLVRDLQADIGKPGVLVGVDDDVPGTGSPLDSSPSQTNSAEIPYPSPASIVRAAVSRIRTRSSAISRSGCSPLSPLWRGTQPGEPGLGQEAIAPRAGLGGIAQSSSSRTGGHRGEALRAVHQLPRSDVIFVAHRLG